MGGAGSRNQGVLRVVLQGHLPATLRLAQALPTLSLEPGVYQAGVRMDVEDQAPQEVR